MRVSERIVIAALTLLVGACSPQPEVARYTLEQYRADADLRHAQVKRCQEDPGTLRKTPDCVNAQVAASFEDRLRLRDAPAVGLGEKSSDETPKEE
ncbi:MAG: EexN family lipoprotein [Pseudomonadota bacterium]